MYIKRALSNDFLHFVLSVVLVLIAPLIFVHSGSSPYETPKYIVILLIAFLAGIYTIVYAFKHTIHTPWIVYMVWAYLFVQWFTSLIGIDRYTSFVGGDIRHQGWILLACCVLIFRFSSLVKNYYFDKLIVVSNILVTVYAFVQLIGIYVFHIGSIPTFQGRLIGTFGSPGFLAGFIVMTLPFVISMYVHKSALISKYILIGLNLIVLFFTFSFTGYISAIVILVIYLVQQHASRIYKIKYLKYALSVFVVNVLVFLLLNQNFHYSIWDNRLLIWSNALSSIQNSPVFGYGLGNFDLLFPKERLMYVDDPHNIFLNVLVSSGIVGLLLFGTLVVYFLRKSNGAVRIALVGFLVFAFFNPLSVIHIALFWYLLGVVNET